jgi:uncharacterized YkwD family protein
MMKWEKLKIHKFRRLPVALLIGVMIIGIFPVSAATGKNHEISVTMQVDVQKAFINDLQYILDQPPIISGNRALVPLRFFSEALGAKVRWESQNRSIEFENDVKQVRLFVNKRTAYIQNKPYQMDVAPIIVNGRTLVPVRFVCEVLGYDVHWNESDQTVMITSGSRESGSLVAVETDRLETASPGSASVETASPASSTSRDHLSIELEVIRLVNIEREKAGLAHLSSRDSLMDTARVKSQDMVDNDYFSHTSPVYGGMSELLNHHQVSYRFAGENIAMGQKTPEAVMKAWMDSQGHRNNILNPNYRRIGVGAVAGGQYGGYTWTQLFSD